MKTILVGLLCLFAVMGREKVKYLETPVEDPQ